MDTVQPSAEPKTLAEMAAEVDAYCQAKGWREEPALFGEAMALLHEEIAEAGSAWRKKGLEAWKLRALESVEPCAACRQQTDIIPGSLSVAECPDHPDKPEGVGSEFADILIRLLDDSCLFGVDLEAEAARYTGFYGVRESFLENMELLHRLVALAAQMHDIGGDYRGAFGAVLVFLRQLCAEYDIDLQAEYARMMAR